MEIETNLDLTEDNGVTMETEYMLSLIDNPFDYFTDFRNWLLFDIEHSQKFNHPTC